MSTTISGTSGVTFPDSTSMQTGQQACKAWVNFNGTGTVSIRSSYNVSSITDNSTGDYTVNFTVAMADANYATVGNTGVGSGGTFTAVGVNYTGAGAEAAPTTTAVRVAVNNFSTLQDGKYTMISIFSN